jgi:non-heme chloroperoxidase
VARRYGACVAHRERYASNDGLRVRYLDNDPPRPLGFPVIFVPGITDFANEYEEVLEFFGRRRLLVVEMRGRGGSDTPAAGYSVPDQAGDVETVIDANRLERFHLMTFSRGTTPAIEVARGRPGCAATLSIGDYLPIEMALPPNFADGLWQSRWRGRPMRERVARHVLERIQQDSRGRELWADLAALTVPVLVARGTDGGILTEEHLERYRTTIPGVEVVAIPGARHDLFRPDRTAYPRAILEFIARRAPGT